MLKLKRTLQVVARALLGARSLRGRNLKEIVQLTLIHRPKRLATEESVHIDELISVLRVLVIGQMLGSVMGLMCGILGSR